MAEIPLDAQKRKEATARYDNLNRRIEAIDRDMSSETDGERLATLREKRADLARDREGVAAELTALEKRTNGDLDMLIRNVAKLGPVLASDNPAEAHAIINECAAALARLDTRVMGLEGRVTAIERHIHPPWIVSLLRFAAAFTVLFAVIVGVWQFPVFVLYPIIAIISEGALISLAAATLFFANAKLQERLK